MGDFFALHKSLYICHKAPISMSSFGSSKVPDEFASKRVTAPDIAARKRKAPIVALTAYHAHTARIIDPYVDMLLVGDSLGMVMHGYETTVPVPLELMIMHAQAVVRGSSRALVVVDMPFGSYEESPTDRLSQCRADPEGDRLRRGQARGRRGIWPRPSAISPTAASR